MSQRILDRLDALARALDDAGVPAAARSRLLESASVAAYHALTLDELRLDRPDVSVPRSPAPRADAEPIVRELAA